LPAGASAPTPVRPGIDTRRQARVERIKAQAKFSADIGQKLKIDTGKFEAANYQAELGRARQTGNFVTIPFRKAGGGVSGINLYRQGKGDKSPQKVGFFFRTPAIDTAPGNGELKYTARAVTNGNEIGQASDAARLARQRASDRQAKRLHQHHRRWRSAVISGRAISLSRSRPGGTPRALLR